MKNPTGELNASSSAGKKINSSTSLPNTVIKGLYQITSPFKETDRAFLFKGRHLENNSPVIIKIVKDRFVNKSEFIETYSKELETASILEKCDLIVKMYDYNYISQRFCVITSFFNSWSLDQILAKSFVLPIHILLKVVKQVAEVTGCAYKEGIPHRHLKLDNILVNINTGDVKVTHFSQAGAAKIGRKYKNKRFSMTSDILSSGILMYRLICFTYPFENRNSIPELIVDSLETSLKRNYKEISENIIKGLQKLFIESTTRDLKRRVETYDEFINTLKQIISQCDIPKKERQKKMFEERDTLSTAFDTVAALRGDLHAGKVSVPVSNREMESLKSPLPKDSEAGLLVWGNKPDSFISLDSPIITFILILLTSGLLMWFVLRLFF